MINPGEQLAKVVAVTTGAQFLDIYGIKGGALDDPFTPEVGEEGYMLLDDARTAQTAGDVLVQVDNTALDIDTARNTEPTPAAITASVTTDPGSVVDAPGAITVAGGPSDGAYTLTLTTEIDSSGTPDVQTVNIIEGDTVDEVADAVADLTVLGITITAAAAVVTLTPGAGTAITTLTVDVA